MKTQKLQIRISDKQEKAYLETSKRDKRDLCDWVRVTLDAEVERRAAEASKKELKGKGKA